MNEIKFLGIGSAFNTKLCSNSCYIKENDSLILIDCGGTVFEKLQKLNILDGIKNLHIIITHTHPDHVGSLGDLIFYAHFYLHIKANIYFPENSLMCSFLSNIGVESNLYYLNSLIESDINDPNFSNVHIEFIHVPHVDTIPSYGFIIKINEKSIYYSGDSSDISEEIINKLKNQEIQRVYQDTCGLDYDGNAHTSIRKLKERVPQELRYRVYCMHLDKSITTEEIEDSGFNVASLCFDRNQC